jgi:hypothetical protein
VWKSNAVDGGGYCFTVPYSWRRADYLSVLVHNIE